MALRRAARVLLVGAPGVGKGTQTERLIKTFPQLSAISSGDLLRDNVRNRTPLGIAAESKMKSGALVPDSMILRLIFNELTRRGWLEQQNRMPYTLNSASTATDAFPSADPLEDDFLASMGTASFTVSDSPSASFILDGFPRTATQAQQIDALVPINLVVHIYTPPSIIIDRISSRWVHAPSGRVYNTTFNPPKVPGLDDVTGERLTRRADDDPAVWKTRLEGFEKACAPLLEHYERKGVLWTVEGKSSDEITPKLCAEFAKRFGR